jgi:hypothetical protein
MKASGGWRWIPLSRDTTTVRAGARAVESGMDGWLGRVKQCAPGRELPSRNDRESFADKHGSGTYWAAETSGLSGGGSDGCMGVRRWIVGEQALTEGQERDTPPIGEEAEKADAEPRGGTWSKKRRRNSCEPSVMILFLFPWA